MKESARPYDEARRLKSRRQADAEAGEFHGRSRVTFHQYAREWVDRYQGNGRRGSASTPARSTGGCWNALRCGSPERLRLVDLTPRHVVRFVGWLCDGGRQ